MATDDRLHFTGDDEADQLLASDPLALLIGFVLDQQVPLQKAFSGPLELRRRIGTLDAAEIAAIEPARLEEVFRRRPAAPLPGIDGTPDAGAVRGGRGRIRRRRRQRLARCA
jgi:3-methyladenine DNA glycosylase/8-oxoguanine DNA glycosylase